MVTETARTIPEEVQSKLGEVLRLCREYHVVELEIFGSAVTNEFNVETSDYDFLVEFDYGNPEFRALRDFFGFKESLERLFDRQVDLVSPSRIENPYRRKMIDQQRIHLFAA